MNFSTCILFFFKQKTAYEMRISDWSSDVCSSDLSIQLLPGWAQALTHANPIFYMVNAFRYGLLDTSDVPLWVAYALMLGFAVALAALALWLLRRGVGLRSCGAACPTRGLSLRARASGRWQAAEGARGGGGVRGRGRALDRKSAG